MEQEIQSDEYEQELVNTLINVMRDAKGNRDKLEVLKGSVRSRNIIKSMALGALFNENRIYPVSVHLDGQYGMNDIFLSVPTIIDKTGAKEIVEINMKEDEQKALEESYKVLKDFCQQLD